MAESVLLIKKYANRRLYDTEKSRYITLDELATTVRGGRRVEIVDAKKGTDLTRAVLLQVILEEQERLDMLPVELLHLLIRTQGTVQQGPLTGWLRGSFDQWANLGESVTSQWTSALGGAANPFESMMKAWTTPSAPPQAPAEPPPPDEAPAPDAAEPEPSLADEAAALRKQMEDLLKRLEG